MCVTKKTIIVALVLILSLSLLSTAQAQTKVPPKVFFNNQPVLFHDAKPAIIQDRTLIPMRTIFQLFGAEVTWDSFSQEITCFENDNLFLRLKINSREAYLRGNTIALDVPPTLINGRTLVPLRFVSEAMGASVTYNEQSNEVYISSSDAKI